jgi:hypothetical protein
MLRWELSFPAVTGALSVGIMKASARVVLTIFLLVAALLVGRVAWQMLHS